MLLPSSHDFYIPMAPLPRQTALWPSSRGIAQQRGGRSLYRFLHFIYFYPSPLPCLFLQADSATRVGGGKRPCLCAPIAEPRVIVLLISCYGLCRTMLSSCSTYCSGLLPYNL